MSSLLWWATYYMSLTIKGWLSYTPIVECIVGWTMRKTLPFCLKNSGPIWITSCSHEKRYQAVPMFAFRESLGTRLASIDHQFLYDSHWQCSGKKRFTITVKLGEWEAIWNLCVAQYGCSIYKFNGIQLQYPPHNSKHCTLPPHVYKGSVYCKQSTSQAVNNWLCCMLWQQCC